MEIKCLHDLGNIISIGENIWDDANVDDNNIDEIQQKIMYDQFNYGNIQVDRAQIHKVNLLKTNVDCFGDGTLVEFEDLVHKICYIKIIKQ